MEGKEMTVNDWIYCSPCADYDHIDGSPEDKAIGEQLNEHIRIISEFCAEKQIPFAMIFSAASRRLGAETRYTSSCAFNPINRVTPEVLLAGLIATNGGQFIAENVGQIVAAATGRTIYLTKLAEELAKLTTNS